MAGKPMQVSKRITVDGITGGGFGGFLEGLPGGGLFYGIRSGSFQMVWDLGKGWSRNGMLSAFMMIWYLYGLCPRDLYSTINWRIVSKIILSGIVSGDYI